MKIAVLGIDGYLGYSLAFHLGSKEYDVSGCDNLLRRRLVEEVGSSSAIPLANIDTRMRRANIGRHYTFDITEENDLRGFLENEHPDAIVHLAEQPSAPYSMKGIREAILTSRNNICGTLNLAFLMREICPECHLIKLGTMGEYGSPQIEISEGPFEIEYKGKKTILPFPRKPISLYHASKVADTTNLRLLTEIWNLKVTDVQQGVVFGVRTPEMREADLFTRFDFDECFGTAINRFVAQGIVGHSLTVYGTGQQQRGFLPLCDSVQCLNLLIDNPPNLGDYREINQLEEIYTLRGLAETVQDSFKGLSSIPDIEHVENPRIEIERGFYEVERKKLLKMGYKPTVLTDELIKEMVEDLLPYKERIKKYWDRIYPSTKWK